MTLKWSGSTRTAPSPARLSCGLLRTGTMHFPSRTTYSAPPVPSHFSALSSTASMVFSSPFRPPAWLPRLPRSLPRQRVRGPPARPRTGRSWRVAPTWPGCQSSCANAVPVHPPTMPLRAEGTTSPPRGASRPCGRTRTWLQEFWSFSALTIRCVPIARAAAPAGGAGHSTTQGWICLSRLSATAIRSITLAMPLELMDRSCCFSHTHRSSSTMSARRARIQTGPAPARHASTSGPLSSATAGRMRSRSLRHTQTRCALCPDCSLQRRCDGGRTVTSSLSTDRNAQSKSSIVNRLSHRACSAQHVDLSFQDVQVIKVAWCQ
eukprot:m.37682 g.37682  ORF g.37682 m.37682 type:complete len:321 (+) comp5458_c0_seq3:344-1306(+)